MKIERVSMPERDPQARSRTFEEVNEGLTEELARREAQRCLRCKNAPCTAGCPVTVRIPEFVAAIAEMTRPHGIKTIVSLNPIMVDGTGMCGGCRVTIGGETKFACVDGPEFDGHQVDFDEMVLRSKRFAREERESMERHQCRLPQR